MPARVGAIRVTANRGKEKRSVAQSGSMVSNTRIADGLAFRMLVEASGELS
jgi:hypothetical protein